MPLPQSSADVDETSEYIQVGDEYYILASALAPQQHRELLSHADSFAIFDRSGDIPLSRRDVFGLFHRDTRFLDRFELRLNGEFPVLLTSTTSEDGSELVSYLSNADEVRSGTIIV